jgi:hypothetical protein
LYRLISKSQHQYLVLDCSAPYNYPAHTMANEPLLLGDVDETLECPVCMGILCNAVSTSVCRHTFCQACIGKVIGGVSGPCPMCRTLVFNTLSADASHASNTPRPNKDVRRQVGQIQVRCGFEGCVWADMLQHWPVHRAKEHLSEREALVYWQRERRDVEQLLPRWINLSSADPAQPLNILLNRLTNVPEAHAGHLVVYPSFKPVHARLVHLHVWDPTHGWFVRAWRTSNDTCTARSGVVFFESGGVDGAARKLTSHVDVSMDAAHVAHQDRFVAWCATEMSKDPARFFPAPLPADANADTIARLFRPSKADDAGSPTWRLGLLMAPGVTLQNIDDATRNMIRLGDRFDIVWDLKGLRIAPDNTWNMVTECRQITKLEPLPPPQACAHPFCRL